MGEEKKTFAVERRGRNENTGQREKKTEGKRKGEERNGEGGKKTIRSDVYACD